MIDPIMKTKEEVKAELDRVTQTIASLNREIQPHTHTDLVRQKVVLRWVLGEDWMRLEEEIKEQISKTEKLISEAWGEANHPALIQLYAGLRTLRWTQGTMVGD